MPKTNRQSHLPAIGQKSADKANRAGGAERCAAPAVPKSIAVALALMTSDDALRRDVARTSVPTARPHDATTLHLWHTVPGIGQMLRLGLLDDSHAVPRVPRGQAVVSSCRLVTWARAAAGTRDGTAGTKIGQAPLTWALSAAAVLGLRAQPAAQPYLARLENKHAQGTARTIRAQQLARAVYHLRTRQVACERERCFQRYGRGADAPGASRDTPGRTLQQALAWALCPAAVHAKAPMRSRYPAPCAWLGQPLSLLCVAVIVVHGLRVLLLTRAWFSLDNATR